MKIFLIVAGFVLALAAGADDLRVVSLSPALTELIFKLDCGAKLVGRSSACDYPAAVAGVPAVGDFASPSLERVARLRPTLVMTDVFQDPVAKASLEKLGAEVLVLPLRNLAEYRYAVLELGRKLGAEKAAAREAERFDAWIADCRRRQPENPPPVLLLVWHDPLMAPGSQSFLTEYIELAGGRSVTAGEDRNYFQLSAEWVLRAKPEVLILSAGVKPGNLPAAWRALKSRRENLAETTAVFRLSPRFDLAADELRTLILK